MSTFIAALLLAYMAASVLSEEERELCKSCIKVNTTCYHFTYIFDLDAEFRNQIVIPKMAVHAQKNTLYFSFEPRIDDPEYSKVGFVSFDDAKIQGVLRPKPNSTLLFNFGAFAIDEEKGNVYMGGSDGVFQISTINNSVTRYSSAGDAILSMYFKDNLYFTKYPQNRIIQKVDSEFYSVKGFEHEYVKDFVIDRHGVIYFLGTYGFFARKGSETVRLSDNAFFRGLTMDRLGDVYAWWIDGVYKVVKKRNLIKYTLGKVCDLPSIGAVAFDRDNNMLVTLGRSLFRLVPTDLEC